MLARRLRRRPNIQSALVERLVFAGRAVTTYIYIYNFNSLEALYCTLDTKYTANDITI